MILFSKIHHVLLCYFVLSFLPLQGQDNNLSDKKKVVGKANYKMITKLRLLTLEQDAVLIFTSEASVFTYSKGEKGFVSKTSDDSDGSQGSVMDGWFQDEIGSVYYKDLKNKKLILREIVWMQPYLTEEPSLPKINWTIQGEQKEVGGFMCQKAEADFRGRHYIAWFTLDIPISDGPWKLQGLPGLILEAYDSKEEVKFILTDLEIPSASANLDEITPPTDGLKASFEEYKKADELEFLKMKKRAVSQHEGSGELEVQRVTPNLLEKSYEK